MDLIVALSPILLLVWLMTKPDAMPSHRALPLAALLAYGAAILWFAEDPNLINATVVEGLLDAWTPILIIWGAILLFKFMEAAGAMSVVRSWLNTVSANQVAQLMIIGWAFSFLIEGASGFGTPAALAAPVLVGLGFPPLPVAVFTVIMNSVPVSFGAVGTPTWFGMGQLGLTRAQLLAIGFDSALIHAVAALVVPVIALRILMPWAQIRANLGFVYLSILACTLPYVALASVSYEFPALLGGAIGLILSIAAARRGIGLKAAGGPAKPTTPVSPGDLTRALFPIWGSVLLLVVTRIDQLGLKGLLTDATPALTAALGSLGDVSVSPSLVVKLTGIFGSEASWTFQALYVPALIPFFLICTLSILVFRMPVRDGTAVLADSWQRMRRTIVAYLGALAMVKLLMAGGQHSMVMTIGDAFATAAGRYWPYLAAYLGAIGSFFSGSATISNLTFSGIQGSIAQALGLNETVMLALQSVGGAMGSMVSIKSILAVSSVLGLANQEGVILKRTVGPMLLYGVIAAVIGQLLMR